MNSKRGRKPKIGPDSIASEIRRIGSLIEANSLAHAEAQALKLLKAHPQRPDVHTILGVAYSLQNKESHAVPHFEFAVKADPENAHYLSNLGRLYVQLGFNELALPFLYRALRIDPVLKAALMAIGKYYRDIGKAELALPYIERLSRLAPQNSVVKQELAESLDSLGRKAEASKLYRELRETASHLIPALYYFSRNESSEDRAGLSAEIAVLLSRNTITDGQRSMLHRSLAFIHERERNYPLAFSHFNKSNSLKAIGFDIAGYRNWVDGVIELFTPDFFAKRSTIGSPSSLPVLVVGMPRSGTTLTEQIIANHGRAGGAGEQSRVAIFARRLSFAPGMDIGKFTPSLDRLGPERLRELGDNYVELLKFLAPKAERVVDKMPPNFQYLGLLSLMCPNARIIHCSRDPVDTCWSCFQNPLNDDHFYSRDLKQLGLYYREYRRLMNHWKAVLPIPIYELSYERLTADFESEARKVIDFLGLPWEDACLDFHGAGRTVNTLSMHQVRNPMHRSSVGRWRHYEKELQPLLSALGDLV